MNKSILTACSLTVMSAIVGYADEKLIILNEGNWNYNNGRLSYFENGAIVSNDWFREKGGIGDTPNHIIQINDNLLAITVNASNIVQFITPEGKAVSATEDVPNNRYMASDGKYIYVTSYGHECKVGNKYVTFEKGYVAKIDVSTYKVVAACEVGYEPDGVALYKGKLFIANTGGYAFSENHDYEHTVSIVDASTMQKEKDIDVERINLYGKMSQSGKYLCITSAGDYYDIKPSTIIFDCEAALNGNSNCYTALDHASTYNCTTIDGNFYIVGNPFSYYDPEGSEMEFYTINPSEVMKNGDSGVKVGLPGSISSDLASTNPYCIYVNPYTGYIYATDAKSDNASAGYLYQWDPNGKNKKKYQVYINPGTILALPPDGHFDGVEDITVDSEGRAADDRIFNLQGMQITNPVEGQLYIRNGKKFIQK
jgi:hypothetical protein